MGEAEQGACKRAAGAGADEQILKVICALSTNDSVHHIRTLLQHLIYKLILRVSGISVQFK